MTTTTRDALFGGKVALQQPTKDRGYRVNVDAVHLAAFAAGGPRRARVAIDLGAGVGAVALSLLHLDAAARVVAVEIDGALAALAAENAAANGWEDRLEVVTADVADAKERLAGAADLVVCNPPYFAPGRGRPAKPARARARSGDLGAFVDAARHVAGRRARVCFVYPANEVVTLTASLRARGLEPKRMRFVHPKPDAPARVVLVESAAAKPGGLVVQPPLIG